MTNPAPRHHLPNNFLAGLLAYVFKPNISHGKIGSRAYSLRQTEVILSKLWQSIIIFREGINFMVPLIIIAYTLTITLNDFFDNPSSKSHS
ncbi:hypothetical protein [Candidatus Midichloria mitochondrii]|uniref:hypothetical protein n=1 Tax=Candidatus Midichloria mitochondrii TaxID=234827 RepID=UPI00192B1D5B|nr:hypothetical protein [Candidatus Midichloria mitochondrii]